jgi:anti-anti-sigma factor
VIDSMEVTYPRPGTCVIALHGEHDTVTAAQTERLFRDVLAVNDLVVVDVGGATFIDSSFLRNLLVADGRAKEQQKTFRLQMGTAPIVRAALEASGILQRLTVTHSREDALAPPTDLADDARD